MKITYLYHCVEYIFKTPYSANLLGHKLSEIKSQHILLFNGKFVGIKLYKFYILLQGLKQVKSEFLSSQIKLKSMLVFNKQEIDKEIFWYSRAINCDRIYVYDLMITW